MHSLGNERKPETYANARFKRALNNLSFSNDKIVALFVHSLGNERKPKQKLTLVSNER